MDGRAHLFDQGDIFINRGLADAEAGDHIADDTAGLGFFFKHIDLSAGTGEEVRRGKTRRAAADDGDLLSRRRGSGLRLHPRVIAVLGSLKLIGADGDRIIVEMAGTACHTAVGADGAGDERQGVLLRDDIEGFLIQALIRQADILGDILMYRTTAGAGRRIAIEERHRIVGFAGRHRFDRLLVHAVRLHKGDQTGDHPGIGTGKIRIRNRAQELGQLGKAGVAAGLEDGGGDGDRPDARREQHADIGKVRAAGVADAELAVELGGKAAGHLDGEVEQRAAAHVHFFGGELVLLHLSGEGVG